MGLFKKIFKGIKKVFKKIGKGIKSVFKKIGKFMGKIGIIGQIGLSLILPGIGGMIGNLAQSMLASGSNALVKGAGHFLRAAVNVGSKVKGMVRTVTDGVTKVIGNVAGTVLNKIPGATDLVKDVTGRLGINSGKGLNMANASFDKALEAAQSAVTDFASQGRDLFSMDTLTSDKYISASTKAAINNAKTDASPAEELVDKPAKIIEPSAEIISKEPVQPYGPPAPEGLLGTRTPVEPYGPPAPEGLLGTRTARHPYSPPKVDLKPTAPDLEAMGEYAGSLKTTAPATKVGLDIAAPDLEAYGPPSFGEKLKALPGQIKDRAMEEIGEKVETLKDPYELAKAGFRTFEKITEEDRAMALQQAALAGEVINVGQYQDPSAFLAYQAPPIAGLEDPISYSEPVSNWGKQFTFNPFNLQTIRGMG